MLSHLRVRLPLYLLCSSPTAIRLLTRSLSIALPITPSATTSDYPQDRHSGPTIGRALVSSRAGTIVTPCAPTSLSPRALDPWLFGHKPLSLLLFSLPPLPSCISFEIGSLSRHLTPQESPYSETGSSRRLRGFPPALARTFLAVRRVLGVSPTSTYGHPASKEIRLDSSHFAHRFLMQFVT